MIAEQSSQSLALSSPGIFILPVPFLLSKFCVLAPLREILRPKSKILIHRNFSFQRHSKLFKAVQSHSRIFRNIFLFLCATAPSGSKAPRARRHPKTQPDYPNLFTPIYSYSSLLPSGGRIFLSATKNIRLYLFANRCQAMPAYASLCQLSPHPYFFTVGMSSTMIATQRAGACRAVAKRRRVAARMEPVCKDAVAQPPQYLTHHVIRTTLSQKTSTRPWTTFLLG